MIVWDLEYIVRVWSWCPAFCIINAHAHVLSLKYGVEKRDFVRPHHMHILRVTFVFWPNLYEDKKIKSCWIEEKLIRTSCTLTRTTLYGFIPNKMSQHFELLVLRDNKFEGKIPQDIFNLSKLYHLDSAENQFSGSDGSCWEPMVATVPLKFSINIVLSIIYKVVCKCRSGN